MRIGASRRAAPDARAVRLPSVGVEVVLEVDDVIAKRDRVIAAEWPLAEDLTIWHHAAESYTDWIVRVVASALAVSAIALAGSGRTTS